MRMTLCVVKSLFSCSYITFSLFDGLSYKDERVAILHVHPNDGF